MERLKKIGFVHIGEWKLENDNLYINTEDKLNAQNALYCYVINGVVMYVGKTNNTLRKRLSGYARPGKSQYTNIRLNEYIKEALLADDIVDLYILTDPDLLRYGAFRMSLVAGLEDSIISTINPAWNIQGAKKEIIKSGDNGMHTLEELDILDDKQTRRDWNNILKMRKKGLTNKEVCSKLGISEEQLDHLANNFHELTGN